MDKPLPDDFDPYLVDESDPVKYPSQSDNKGDQQQSAPNDGSHNEEESMHGFLPASLKRIVLTGSCCTGVGVLYLLSSWDHGWIPGVRSPFAEDAQLQAMDRKYIALQSDVAELYILSIARAIRDLQADICLAPSISKAEQLEALQYKYIARTGARYPHTTCT